MADEEDVQPLLEDIIDPEVVRMALEALCVALARKELGLGAHHQVFRFAEERIRASDLERPTPTGPPRSQLLEYAAANPLSRQVQRLLDAMEQRTDDLIQARARAEHHGLDDET